MIDFKQIRRKNILVVGDIMLDTYYMGNINRISPEAPVPIFRKLSERAVLGGAANVAANLIAANQNVSLMSIIGKDDIGQELLAIIGRKGIDDDLISKIDRRTTVKTRFLAGNNQQVMRLDVEDTDEIDGKVCHQMLKMLASTVDKYDLILVSDYLKGLLTEELTQGIILLGKKSNTPVIIDVKDTNTSKYKGAFLLKPNLHELRDMTGLSAITDEEIAEAAEYLRSKCECEYVLCTCGSRGMVLVGDMETTPYWIKAETREVFDVSGAGDTAIAYVAVGLSNKIDIKESVTMANIASGIQVGKVGTSSVYMNEVKDYLQNKYGGSRKILQREDVESLRQDHIGKKIVFTNGCFDILHVGHKRYLQAASTLGDILVVGVNSDASVRRLKGEGRPVNNEEDRMEMLSAMECVDYVAMFEEDTPYELINKVQPDVLVKGGDYKKEDVVGGDIVESRGGRVEIIKFVEGKSTTNIINSIKND